MRPVEDRKLLDNLNVIEEGLNFLVPNTWWRAFFQDNQNIKCHRELRLSQSYPLDYLFEAGIIEQPLKTYKQHFNNMKKETQVALKTIKKQLKRAELVQGDQNEGKRTKVPCQWLWEKGGLVDQREESTHKTSLIECDLLLLSPQIKPDMAELFELHSDDWTVVSPELYRLIWNQETRDRRCQAKTMVAIPVLISKKHRLYMDDTIDYRDRKFVQIFIKNCAGYNFCFIGYVDGDITFKSLLKWIDEGMFKLVADPKDAFSIKHKNMVIAMTQGQEILAYSFYDDVYNEKLGWAEFQVVEDIIISSSKLKRIIAFVGSNSEKEKEEKAESDHLTGRSRKKRSIASSIGGGEMGLSLRAEVRPIVIQGQGGSYPRVPPVDIIEVHSSTQEETPSDLGPRVVAIPAPETHFTNSRIPFPIWKQSLSVQNLVKLAHIRSSIPKIFIPNHDESTIVVKDEGKKVVLQKQSNELVLNQMGILQQRDTLEPVIGENAPISQGVKKQLEILASEILGMKISELSEQAEKVEIDLAKQNSECEDRTCKNDFLDQLDCEESRQF